MRRIEHEYKFVRWATGAVLWAVFLSFSVAFMLEYESMTQSGIQISEIFSGFLFLGLLVHAGFSIHHLLKARKMRREDESEQ